MLNTNKFISPEHSLGPVRDMCFKGILTLVVIGFSPRGGSLGSGSVHEGCERIESLLNEVLPEKKH